MADLVHRIVVDLSEVQRIAREVVATEPGPRVAEVLVERLRSMHAEPPLVVSEPTAEDLARARARMRRWGLG